MKLPQEYSFDHIVGAGNYSIYASGNSLFMPRLLQTILSSTDKVLSNVSLSGALTKDLSTLFNYIEENGGRKVVEKVLGDYVYVFEDYSYLDIDFNKKNNNIANLWLRIKQYAEKIGSNPRTRFYF